MPEIVTPTSFEAAAAALAGAAAGGHAVRIEGGGTKLGWGARGGRAANPHLVIRTSGIDQTLEHNVGDLTASFAAGVPLARVQAELAAAGQILAIDPPLGGAAGEPSATIGGVFATADSGPLSHRYGSPRDQILGITVALSDGTIARAGGRVIKNVAGYDLSKLFTGAFGTLGLILSVNVRLHTMAASTATALGAAADADVLAAAARAIARQPFELEALDIAWRGGRGGLLAQVAGGEAGRRAVRVAAAMKAAGLDHVDVTTEDAPLWARQRAGQRSAQRAIVRVSTRPGLLADVLKLADRNRATLVGRAALGVSYLELDPTEISAVREGLPAGASAVVLDLPPRSAPTLDVWGLAGAPELALMQAVKARFDPAAVCNPGVFVGGI